MPVVGAPTVVILAAGEGTRMRSQTPKVLHELCGRPLVLWPVQAALEAGAQRVVVVDSPAQGLRQVLPEGVQVAVQVRPNGTGGALAAAFAQLPANGSDAASRDAGPLVVLSGDVPLVSAEVIAELAAAHRRAGAAATMATAVLEDPRGYGRVVRDGDGAVQRVVETKADADATSEEREIREVNTGVYVFEPGELSQALAGLAP